MLQVVPSSISVTAFQFAWYFYCPSPVGLCHSSSASQRVCSMFDFVPRIINDGPNFHKISPCTEACQTLQTSHAIFSQNFRVCIFLILSRGGNVIQPFGKKSRFNLLERCSGSFSYPQCIIINKKTVASLS